MLAFFPPLPLIYHFCIYNMLIVRRLLSLIIPAEFLQKSRCGWDDLVFDLRMIVPGKKNTHAFTHSTVYWNDVWLHMSTWAFFYYVLLISLYTPVLTNMWLVPVTCSEEPCMPTASNWALCPIRYLGVSLCLFIFSPLPFFPAPLLQLYSIYTLLLGLSVCRTILSLHCSPLSLLRLPNFKSPCSCWRVSSPDSFTPPPPSTLHCFLLSSLFIFEKEETEEFMPFRTFWWYGLVFSSRNGNPCILEWSRTFQLLPIQSSSSPPLPGKIGIFPLAGFLLPRLASPLGKVCTSWTLYHPWGCCQDVVWCQAGG